MQLTKAKKIFLGVLTLWPIIYIIMFMLIIFSTVFLSSQGFQAEGAKFFFIIFILHFFTILYSFGLIGFYIYYIFKTDRVPKDKKALWAAIIFLANIVVMPIFWFLYIWRDSKNERTSGEAA